MPISILLQKWQLGTSPMTRRPMQGRRGCGGKSAGKLRCVRERTEPLESFGVVCTTPQPAIERVYAYKHALR